MNWRRSFTFVDDFLLELRVVELDVFQVYCTHQLDLCYRRTSSPDDLPGVQGNDPSLLYAPVTRVLAPYTLTVWLQAKIPSLRRYHRLDVWYRRTSSPDDPPGVQRNDLSLFHLPVTHVLAPYSLTLWLQAKIMMRAWHLQIQPLIIRWARSK